MGYLHLLQHYPWFFSRWATGPRGPRPLIGTHERILKGNGVHEWRGPQFGTETGLKFQEGQQLVSRWCYTKQIWKYYIIYPEYLAEGWVTSFFSPVNIPWIYHELLPHLTFFRRSEPGSSTWTRRTSKGAGVDHWNDGDGHGGMVPIWVCLKMLG